MNKKDLLSKIKTIQSRTHEITMINIMRMMNIMMKVLATMSIEMKRNTTTQASSWSLENNFISQNHLTNLLELKRLFIDHIPRQERSLKVSIRFNLLKRKKGLFQNKKEKKRSWNRFRKRCLVKRLMNQKSNIICLLDSQKKCYFHKLQIKHYENSYRKR